VCDRCECCKLERFHQERWNYDGKLICGFCLRDKLAAAEALVGEAMADPRCVLGCEWQARAKEICDSGSPTNATT